MTYQAKQNGRQVSFLKSFLPKPSIMKGSCLYIVWTILPKTPPFYTNKGNHNVCLLPLCFVVLMVSLWEIIALEEGILRSGQAQRYPHPALHHRVRVITIVAQSSAVTQFITPVWWPSKLQLITLKCPMSYMMIICRTIKVLRNLGCHMSCRSSELLL